jgi:hypothetical protein
VKSAGLRTGIATAPMVATIALAGCGSLFPSPRVEPSAAVDYTLHVSNGTTLALSVIVNGQSIGVAPAGINADYTVDQLPGLPWAVETRTVSGRLILQLDVQPGSVIDIRNADGSGSHSAPARRADLSCGRLDLYVGSIGMLGPAPGPGVPGDCVP